MFLLNVSVMHHCSHYVPSFHVIRFNALGHFQTSLLKSLIFRARRSAITSAPPQPQCSTPLLLPRYNHAGPSPTGVPAEATVGSRLLPPIAAAAAAAAVARAAALGRRATTALAGGWPPSEH